MYLNAGKEVVRGSTFSGACLVDRNTKLPVTLSWVLVPAEQRQLVLEHPLVRPAGSWRALSLCVHSNLPGRKADMRAPSNYRAKSILLLSFI